MTEERLHKCCACKKNKVHLKRHLQHRHNLFWQFLGEKLSNRGKLDDVLLQKHHKDFRKRVHTAIHGVIDSILDPEIRKIVRNDKLLKKYIKSKLKLFSVMERDRISMKLIRNDILLTVKLMKLAWKELDNDDFQDLTISTLMIPAHTQIIKDSLIVFSTQSRAYPGKVMSILRTCAKLTGTESDFSITCNEIRDEYERARKFPEIRTQSCSSNVVCDDTEVSLPPKKKRRVYTHWEKESNDSMIDDGELSNDNSIEESFDKDKVQPQPDNDEQAVSKSQDSTLAIDPVSSRVDEQQGDCLHDFSQAKQKLEDLEPEVHNVIAEPSTAQSDQHSDEAVNDSLNVQSTLSSLDLLDELVRILEDEEQQQTEILEDNCQELSTTLDNLQIRLNEVKIQMKTNEVSVSLNKNRLEEQQKEQRILQSDLESLRPSIKAITALFINSSDSSSVHQIQNRVKELQNEYTNLIAKSIDRGKFLKEISEQLHEFLTKITKLEPKYSQSKTQESPEFNFEDYKAGITQWENKLGEQQFNLEMLIKKGKNLVDKENVTDAASIRTKIEALESQLKELNNVLDGKPRESTGEQFTIYHALLERDYVLDWLTEAEKQVARLHSVGAVNIKELKMKNEDLKVIQKEYMDYKKIIDRIGDFLRIHDSLPEEHGESPTKEPTNLHGVHPKESVLMEQFPKIRERYEQLSVKLSYRQSELLVANDSILKEFLDGYNSLNPWLATMERLVNAQEKISIERAIINLQSKQIHVLQEEFRMKKPEFDHWVELGQMILSADSVKIDIKVNDIRKRWQYQIDHLDRRAQDLNDSLNSHSGFYANVHYLCETLEKITVDIDALPFDEQLEEQLTKIDDLKSKLREALNEVKISIQGQLTVIENLFKDLQEKVQHQKANIEETLRDRRQFKTSCNEILSWLASELQNIPEKLLISANQAVIQQQLDQYKKIHDAVTIKETQAMELIDKGRDIMVRASKTNNEAIKEDLDKMKTQLDRLKKEISNKRIKLETCAEYCQKYYRDFSSLSSSVQETNIQLQNLTAPKYLTVSVSDAGLNEHIKALNSFALDILKRSEAFKDLKLLGKTFLNSCDIDTDVVENQLKDMENRWLTLFSELNDYTVFNERLSNLRIRLISYENRLMFYTNLENSSEDKIKKLREDTKALEKDLQIVKELARKLASLSEAIDRHVIDVSDRICDLCGKLDNLIPV